MTKTEQDIEVLTEQPYKTDEKILDGKFTKATHFLLPGLHISTNLKNFTRYFVNSFINDEGIEHIVRNPLFVLFKTKAFDEDWEEFAKSLKKSPRCVYEYVVGKFEDDYLVMFLFEYPIAYREDYYKFLEGKYSQFSEHFKKLFEKTYTNEKGEEIEHSLYGVVNKTPTFKKRLEKLIDEPIDPSGEYWAKPTEEREVFRKKQK